MTINQAITLLSKKWTVVQNADSSISLYYKDTGIYIDTYQPSDYRALK